MKRLGISIVLLALTLASTVAQAQGYVGLGLGIATYDYDDVDDSTAFKAFAGHRMQDGLLGFEGGYVDLGEADITSLPGLELGLDGFYGAATLNAQSGAWTTYAKLGAYSLDATLSGPGGSISESSTGLHWGLGIGYQPDLRGFGFRFALDSYEDVEDFSAEESVLVIGVAGTYAF
jgi:hypothetical protein